MPLKGGGQGSQVVEPALWASTGTSEPARRKAFPLLQTGNGTLDQLLGGGIKRGTVTLLYSASRRLSLLLQQLAVLAQLPQPDGGFNAARVLFVDAENTFDPYGIANFAVAHRLDPTRTLGNIFLTPGVPVGASGRDRAGKIDRRRHRQGHAARVHRRPDEHVDTC